MKNKVHALALVALLNSGGLIARLNAQQDSKIIRSLGSVAADIDPAASHGSLQEASAALGRIFGEASRGGIVAAFPVDPNGKTPYPALSPNGRKETGKTSQVRPASWLNAAAQTAPIEPVPVDASAELRKQVEKAAKGSEYAAESLSDAALALATPDQKVAMLQNLIQGSNPRSGGDGGPDPMQQDRERAIVRILASAPDAAAFDRLYYRLDSDRLNGALQDPYVVQALLDKARASAKPGDWDGLARYVDTVADTKSSGRNLVEFLIDGAGVIAPAQAVLEGAGKSIHIEVFQLQGDEIGWAVARELAAKAQKGVHVRLMIDEHGSEFEHDDQVQKLIAFLKDGGAEVIVKKPPLDESHLDHRKVMVVDGDTGFTGGMNIGKSYQVDWHDQQTFIMGPAVAKLQDAFIERWQAAGGRIPNAELADLYPPLKEFPEGSEIRVVGHIGGRDQNIKAMYLRAFATAEQSIRIANPYFLDADVVRALIAAARRHVAVQVVLPEDNDVAIVQRGSRAFYPDLLKAGVEIYEYKGRMAHEKVAVIDGRWATFGSSNLDARSLKNNDELNIVASDPNLAQYIDRNLFDVDLGKSDRIRDYSPTLRERIDRWLGPSL